MLALTSYSWAFSDNDPAAAYETGRRAMAIARDSGNRYVETTTYLGVSRLAVSHGDPIEAIGLLIDATNSYYDTGSSLLVPGPLALIGVLLDRFGRHETAATIMGFAERPATRTTFPETASTIAHLREKLGDRTYESLARNGAAMTTATAVTYALNEIEHARAELLDAESP